MDVNDAESKEQLSNGCSEYQGTIFQIKDLDLKKDINAFLPVFWQSWMDIHGADLSDSTQMQINGKTHDLPKIEALLYWYLHDQGSKVRIYSCAENIFGFVIYNPVFDGVIAIRLLYILKEFRNGEYGKNLVESIPGLGAVLFQTKKDMPPKLLFEAIKNRPIRLFENDLTVTYSMEWGN